MSSLGESCCSSSLSAQLTCCISSAPSKLPQFASPSDRNGHAAPPLTLKEQPLSQPTSARATPSPLGSDDESASECGSPQQEHRETQESVAEQEEEGEEEFKATPLPTRALRPKGLQERQQLCAEGRNGGRKSSSLAAGLGRKRADSLKWSKYATMAPVCIELGLSNDELSRKD